MSSGPPQTPNNSRNIPHDDTPHPQSRNNDIKSDDDANNKPSLLRIGLSAGFTSLSQQQSQQQLIGGSPTKGYSTATTTTQSTKTTNTSSNKASLLSSQNEEEITLSYIRRAQDIINTTTSNSTTTKSLSTLAALSNMGGEVSQNNELRGVLVNVIDPTSGPSSQIVAASPPTLQVPDTPPSATQNTGKGLFGRLAGGGNNNETSKPTPPPTTTVTQNSNIENLNIYNKLTSKFNNLHNSTLHSLPYKHPRTSQPQSISTLPINFNLTSIPNTTPQNWHLDPYCHVYVATVQNIDHYRTKVRPAIRAFVNQLEGSGMVSATKQSTTNGGVGGKDGGNVKRLSIEADDSHAVPPPPPLNTAASPATTPSRDQKGKAGTKGKKSANEKALVKAGLSVGKTIVAGNFGSRYVIIFVPLLGSSGNGSDGGLDNKNHGNKNGGFGGFRARNKGGQQSGVVLSNSKDTSIDNDASSVVTSTTSTSTQHQDSGSSATTTHQGQQQQQVPTTSQTKEIKELYHKFLKDFPNGRTVIMGSLLNNNDREAQQGVGGRPIQNQEWKAFLHNLGNAIVDGFHDRVCRYSEELRRLDSKRINATADSSKLFDLSNFFLVKESLAFTYEQMQLYEEAKLQYEELYAFLPEDGWRRKSLTTEASDGEENDNEEDGIASSSQSSPADLAIAGDSTNFRQYIQVSGKDLQGVSQYLPHYMYAREVRLLFQMGGSDIGNSSRGGGGSSSAAVDVLTLSTNFIQQNYHNRLLNVTSEYNKRYKEEIEDVALVDSMKKDGEEGIVGRQNKLRRERLWKEAEVEAWALASCWDIKVASGHYFIFDSMESLSSSRNGSPTRTAGKLQDSSSTESSIEEVQASRCLAELLEFAILRLMRLADLALGANEEDGTTTGERRINPIRRATSERPVDTLKPWKPWRKLQKIRDEIKTRHLRQGNNEENNEAWPSILPIHGISPWIHSAMENATIYEETYLELAEAAVTLNRLAGRFRFASRLEDHRAEVLIAREEYTQAAQVLSSNVGACARDQWTRAHYWRIFRLACCQRMSGDVLAYLETLTQSFNPKLSSVAPKKTASLFQQDLEAIITDAAVAEPRWGAFPFLETELSIESECAGKSTQPLPFLRRKLTKNLCSVGNELKFSLSIHSHLPRPIAVNGIRLYLITLEQYEFVYRRNGIVSEDDAFRTLTIDTPTVDIMPGKNEFSFSWQPMTSNSYVLATVEIQWKEASFFYDSALLRKPMIGLDIQPSEPTQTIELNPLFLIPGHVQNVRLVFHSGSDFITEGQVKLICSEGLLVVPPKTDPSKLDEEWSDECIIPLESIGPGKKIVITTLVKSSTIKLGDNTDLIQTMWAKVETRYRQESYASVMEKGEEPESDPMKTLLEAMVTTLDRPALAVDDAEAFLLGDDHVMVNIALQCNSPVPFYIKEWHLDVPAPLSVDEEDGDLNKGMFKHAIPEGEMLLFGFKCIRSESSEDHNKCERPLLRVVLQDEYGKTFLQVLPVSLEDIYKKIRKEDNYAEVFTATAELTCTVNEGAVGLPVPFVYDLNLQSLITPKQRKRMAKGNAASVSSAHDCPILYTIVSDDCDWIVSGKVQGLIKPSSLGSESLLLHFRGIPTQSGILRNFPQLYLEYLPTSDNSSSDSRIDLSPPITVQCHCPDSFQSFAYTSSLSLAVPAIIDEF